MFLKWWDFMKIERNKLVVHVKRVYRKKKSNRIGEGKIMWFPLWEFKKQLIETKN